MLTVYKDFGVTQLICLQQSVNAARAHDCIKLIQQDLNTNHGLKDELPVWRRGPFRTGCISCLSPFLLQVNLRPLLSTEETSLSNID